MAERAEPETGRAAASAAATPNTPGSRLSLRRGERGLEIKQAAAELRVDVWMLEALEKDDYAAFGAPVFAKGHLRKYAALLGIASEDIMVAYYQLEGARDAPPLVTEAQAASVPPPRSPLLALILIAAALIALAVVAWLWLSGDTGDSSASRAASSMNGQAGEVSDNSPPPVSVAARSGGEGQNLSVPASGGGGVTPGAPATPAAQVEAGSRVVDAQAELAMDGRIDSAGQQGVASAGRSSVLAPQIQTAQTSQAATQSGSRTNPETRVDVPAAASTGPSVQIQIAFDQESWVEISDANGQRLLYGMATAGSVESLRGLAPVEVFLGRAPGVQLSVNGQPFVIPEEARRGNVARFQIQREPGAL